MFVRLFFIVGTAVLSLSLWTIDSRGQDDNQTKRGKQLYLKNCFVCHQLDGKGVPGTFPPLAQSDYLLSDKDRSIRILCEGLSGEITVNGKKYAGAMPAAVIDDAGLADLLTYVRTSWENSGEPVTSDEVKIGPVLKTQFPDLREIANRERLSPPAEASGRLPIA